ncbi:MAG: hypothetical protein EPO13_11070 [Actinomycetota bacterium]|nr:MAG: hypothetical protein EPO13_11070 [Actinomycetota bacterium]
MQFNHVAVRIDPAHFELIVDMLVARLGFVELRRIDRAIWLRQPGTNIDLQLTHSTTSNRDDDKRRSQVSFLSLQPRQDLDDLVGWLGERGLPATVGVYSDREFYLDAPAAFVDFVIEAMRPELAEYDVQV